MSPTHNKLKNIQHEVFSKEASSFDKEKLKTLNDELMDVYQDSIIYPHSKEWWNETNGQIQLLVSQLPQPKKNKWYVNHVVQFFIALSVLAIGIFLLQPLQKDHQEETSQQKTSTTATHK